MSDWHNIYITDKTGAKFFNTTASPMSTMSEIRNLKRHVEQAKAYPHMYYDAGIDVPSMVLMLDGTPWEAQYEGPLDMDADALLAELGL